MATRMQQRRGTAEQWTTANPVLAAGEIGFETDTNQFKIGDGVNQWSALSYFKNLEDLGGLDDFVTLAMMGAANGVATLDGSGKIPVSQLPDATSLEDEVTAVVNALTTDAIEEGSVNRYFTEQRAIDAVASSIDTAVTNAVNDLVGTAPAALNTLGELATALDNDESFAATVVGYLNTVENNLDLHEGAVSGTHGVVGAIVGEQNAQTLTNKTIDGYNNTITNIAESSVIDLTTNLAAKAPLASPVFSGDVDFSTTTSVTGLTKTTVGLGNVDNTADLDKPVSTATQSALDTKQDKVADVSDVEIGYLNGVTGPIQTQFSDLALSLEGDLNDHASATINVHGIADTSVLATNASVAAEIDAHVAVTTGVHGIADTAELETQTGAQAKADNAQSAAEGYADTAISTHNSDTTNVHGIADTSLLITTAGGTVANLIISGDLTVSGTTTTVGTQDLVVNDPMIYMGDGNAANLVDLGIVSSFNDGTYQHTGLVRDASEGKWKLFKGVTDEPTTTINFSQGSLDDLAVADLGAEGIVADTVTANTLYYGGITGATSVQAELEKKTPELYTFTTVSGTTKTIATADKFASLKFTSASAVTVTVPTNASDAIPVGAYFEIYQWGDGQITVSAATPATTFIRSTDSQNKSRTKYSAMLLIKVDTDEWLLTGDLTA